MVLLVKVSLWATWASMIIKGDYFLAVVPSLVLLWWVLGNEQEEKS